MTDSALLQHSHRSLQAGAGTVPWPRAHVAQSQAGEAGVKSALGMAVVEPESGYPARLSREQRIRRSVLLSFRDPFPGQCEELRTLSRRQWERLLSWLDRAGLALPFFDRIVELQLVRLLPEPVYKRLQQNLRDNIARTEELTAESAAIQQQFETASLSYALLKGLSFWPNSVAKPELRLQFDNDFLVAEADLEEAREILLRRGYRLYGDAPTCLEFKRNEKTGLKLKDIYRPTGGWKVEVHVESGASDRTSVLEHVERRDFFGYNMHVLSPVDLLIRQGLHAYKHICGEFTRAAHLVEFRRHVLMHGSDSDFWEAVRARANEDEFAAIALGVVTLVISRLMGEFAPEALRQWTVDRLPRAARLWVEMYGDRAVLGDYPGSKLYLLLQESVQAEGTQVKKPAWRSLVPLSLPPPVMLARPNETLRMRLGRMRMLMEVVVSRLRFHIVEGLRFPWESRRWRRQLERVAS